MLKLRDTKELHDLTGFEIYVSNAILILTNPWTEALSSRFDLIFYIFITKNFVKQLDLVVFMGILCVSNIGADTVVGFSRFQEWFSFKPVGVLH